jgi:predicted nucleic acid-binding protein
VIVVDTSVLSRAFRRKKSGAPETAIRAELERLMADDRPIGLPGIVLQEVLSGVRSERQFADLAGRLIASFAILHPTTTDCIEAARLRNTCVSRGLNVSGPDCLIARLAIAGNHQLFAIDTDFAAIAEQAPLLQMYDYGAS